VHYVERDGSLTLASVVSVDISIQPPSYAVRLHKLGSVRETEGHRLLAIPPAPAVAGPPAAAAIGPQQRPQQRPQQGPQPVQQQPAAQQLAQPPASTAELEAGPAAADQQLEGQRSSKRGSSREREGRSGSRERKSSRRHRSRSRSRDKRSRFVPLPATSLTCLLEF
jgi:hypothetical protein